MFKVTAFILLTFSYLMFTDDMFKNSERRFNDWNSRQERHLRVEKGVYVNCGAVHSAVKESVTFGTIWFALLTGVTPHTRDKTPLHVTRQNYSLAAPLIFNKLIGVLSQPLAIISGLTETFMKRYTVERTNKAEITPEEQNEKTESYRENYWHETQLKGP